MFSDFQFKILCASLISAALIVLLLLSSLIIFEPVVSRAITDEFTVTQTVSSAIAFAASTTDVTMDGTLDGLTGGTSYGTTTVRVTSNNATGYNLSIKFSSTTAMIRNGSTASEIQNYVYSTSTASYPAGFDTSLAYAQFGFTVNASTTSEISSVFTHNGSLCGTSNNGSFTVNNCWRGASSTNASAATELINSSAPTPASGSTSTVQFRITIPNGPVPSVPNGTYVATATLTALDN